MVRRLLTIGHSYCVSRNRELANAIARVGAGAWEVHAVAPPRFPGDLGPIEAVSDPSEPAALHLVPVRGARVVHLMWYARALHRLLSEPWDVVHCWEEPYVLAAAQVARSCRPSSALVYATFQNIGKQYPPPFAGLERFSIARARGWIAFGHTVETTLERRKPYDSRPHTVIPFGVDVDRLTPDARAGTDVRGQLGWRPDGPAVIGYLGRFVEPKGVGFLLGVLDELSRRGTEWRALFVGGGPLEERLRQYGARYPDRVRVVTDVSHDRVVQYLRGMDVLCVPSQTTPRWREQFGRMIIEAFACGVPVLGSDSGEIPLVIGDAGIVVGESDHEAWARELQALLADSNRRRMLGAAGRRRAEERFAWTEVAARHLAFFDQLLRR